MKHIQQVVTYKKKTQCFSISVLFIQWGCSYIIFIFFSIKYITFQFLKAKLDINNQVSSDKKQLIFKCQPRQSTVSAVKNALQI